jgi:hypothetical protein
VKQRAAFNDSSLLLPFAMAALTQWSCRVLQQGLRAGLHDKRKQMLFYQLAHDRLFGAAASVSREG